MANKNGKSTEEVALDPVMESRELEKSQSEAGLFSADVVTPHEKEQHVILTRDNLTLVVPNVWRYKHDSALSECKVKSAFYGEMAKNFGIRPLDIVICQNDKEACLVVVPLID